MSSLYYNPNSGLFRFHIEDFDLFTSFLKFAIVTEYDYLYGDVAAENGELPHFFIRFRIISSNPYTEELIIEWADAHNVQLTVKEG